jgi:hypothetical protein
LSAPNESNRNSSGNEAGAAPRRERNVSPAGEFSAPHNVASERVSLPGGQPTQISLRWLRSLLSFLPPWTKSNNGHGVTTRTVSTQGWPPKTTPSRPTPHRPLRLSSPPGTVPTLLGLTDTPLWSPDRQREKRPSSASSWIPATLRPPPLKTSSHPSPSSSRDVLATPLTSAPSRSISTWTFPRSANVSQFPSPLRTPRPWTSGTTSLPKDSSATFSGTSSQSSRRAWKMCVPLSSQIPHPQPRSLTQPPVAHTQEYKARTGDHHVHLYVGRSPTCSPPAGVSVPPSLRFPWTYHPAFS